MCEAKVSFFPRRDSPQSKIQSLGILDDLNLDYSLANVEWVLWGSFIPALGGKSSYSLVEIVHRLKNSEPRVMSEAFKQRGSDTLML